MKSLIRVGRGLALAVAVVAPVGGFVAWVALSAGQPPQAKEAGPTKAVSVPWTTSRVVGTPDPPPPFKVVRAFPDLKFTHPLLMARLPGSDRLFVGEQDGVLYSFVGRTDARAELFYERRRPFADRPARTPGRARSGAGRRPKQGGRPGRKGRRAAAAGAAVVAA